MIAREFKAKIVDDFAIKWLEAAADNERITVDSAKEFYDGPSFQALAARISGAVVTILENTYQHGSTDYFEKIDDNFVIDPELFQEI